MPQIMDPAAQRRYLKDNVDADFVFLLEEHGVELALQYAIGQHYKSIRTFAAFTDDRAGARTAITADFGVRPDSAADRAKIATVITAWEASKLIREEEAKLRAEAKVMGVQKPLASSDRAAMRIALETVRGYSVPESEEPAPEYLAHKLEQIENGEPTASYLDEVISRKESNSLQLQTSLDNQGRLRVMRQKPKGRLPQNTEELLGKIRLEAATWVMLSAKCRGRAYLQDVQLCNLLISTVTWSFFLVINATACKWLHRPLPVLLLTLNVRLLMFRGMFCCSTSLNSASGPSRRRIARGFLLGISFMMLPGTRSSKSSISPVRLLSPNGLLQLIPLLPTSGSERARAIKAIKVARMAKAIQRGRQTAKSRSGRPGSTWSPRLRMVVNFAMHLTLSVDVR